jgi:hypothetical protein
MIESHVASFVEVRAALPLDGGVKCRQPERVEDGGNRSVSATLNIYRPRMDANRVMVVGQESWGKTGQKRKLNVLNKRALGFGLLLTILMVSLMPMSVQAWSWTTYPEPSDDEIKETVAEFLLDNHEELDGLTNYTEWEVELSRFLNFTSFKLRASWVHEDEKCNLLWIGSIFWTKYSPSIHVTEIHYTYEVDIAVEKIGPGTTNPASGVVYTVPGGSSYSYTATELESEYPDEYYFRFVKWTVDDGVSTTDVYGDVISGVAYVDLTITAIFETQWMSHCTIRHEDGLEQGYLWRDDHVLLSVRAKEPSTVTVIILSEYGAFEKTYYTTVRSFNVYFTAQRFVGEYEVMVFAESNSLPYDPNWLLAGVSGIMDKS